MDRRIIINYIYNILYQVVKIILPVVLVPYTMSHLGADYLGISDFAGNIANWFIIFGVLGVNLYGNRQIAKVRDDQEELSETFFEILYMQFVNMAIAIVCYFVYVKLTVNANLLIYYLSALNIVGSMFDITWFFYGVEDFKSVSIRNIVIKILGVGLIFLLVKNPSHLWLYVVINTVTTILGQVIMFFQLKKYIHFKKVNFWNGYKKHINATFVLFIPTIAIDVYTLLDQTMLGYLSDNVANVTLYKTAQSFVKMFLYFITSIGAVMLPRVTNVFYNKENGKEEVEKYINITFRIAMYFALPMMVAMITVSPYFIPWYLPTALSVGFLIQISSPIIIFISMSNVFGVQYLIPTGLNKEYTKSVCFGAASNCVVNAILIPFMGGVGAAIGSVVAEFVVTFTQYLYIKNRVKVNFTDKNIFKNLIAAIVMGVVVVVIGQAMGASIITNMVQACVGGALYFVILFVLKEEYTHLILKKIFKKG